MTKTRRLRLNPQTMAESRSEASHRRPGIRQGDATVAVVNDNGFERSRFFAARYLDL